MPPQLVRSRVASLSFLAGCATAIAGPETPAPAQAVETVATLRAEGPPALARLLARYDRTEEGPARAALARTIDAVAGQRYATVSRLYWYTDLAVAAEVAREQQRPILSLRMLGRLDEDLSCANSRLFRTVLYANDEVSKFLRDNFVLYWSSERAVPKVTIDFGDGRKIERTVTGNSAHYVLDDEGNVIDVLPGLYAPALFKAELTKSLALAKHVRGRDASQRAAAIRQHHAAAIAATNKQFAGVAGGQFARPRGGQSDVERAERMTVSKAVVEMPELEQIGIDAGKVPTDDITQWVAIAQHAWRFQPVLARTRTTLTSFDLLDKRSVNLITRLHNAGPHTATITELGNVVRRLELHVIADSALNQFRLRQQIRARLVSADSYGFEAVNEWIYREVFATPKNDAWLGLLSRTDFTGLPGDGVVMP